MGNNPFQDQLLKAGLTTEKKIRKQSQAKSQENKNKVGKKKKIE